MKLSQKVTGGKISGWKKIIKFLHFWRIVYLVLKF